MVTQYAVFFINSQLFAILFLAMEGFIMGTLVLRFDKFLDQGSNRSGELYGDSLRKQYSVIESRTPPRKKGF